MGIQQEIVRVTTTGSAGSATGSGTSATIRGYIEDVFIDYNSSAPVTTDVTLAFAERGGYILMVSNTSTDGLYQPRVKPVDNTNAAITNAHDKFACNQPITVSVAQCDALTDAVTVYIRYSTN